MAWAVHQLRAPVKGTIMRRMTLRVVVRETRLPFPQADVFAWFMRPGALERLLPPWSGVEVRHRLGQVAEGGELEMLIPAFGRQWQWIAKHEILEPGTTFVDVQKKGPFRSWRHVHRVRADGDGCVVEDQVEFEAPAGALGHWLIAQRVEQDLDRLFAWRRDRLIDDLSRHQAYPVTPMRIALSGAGGLMGSQLAAFLSTGGHEVLPLVRKQRGHGIDWDPGRSVDEVALATCQAVIHLAGSNVAASRWTPEIKSKLWSSRIDATKHLCETLARQEHKPKVLICASGAGYYGLHREFPVKEDSAPGNDFLAELCQAWEAACEPARAAGIRVVNIRFGVVLSAVGGALPKMLPAVRWGVAGPIAGGKQHVPWIALDDAIGIVHAALCDPEYQGPINAMSPEAITNRQLMKTLGAVLHRPTWFPLPGFMVRLLFGEMGEATLLANCNAVPGQLLAHDFQFRHRSLKACLQAELGCK